MTYLPTSHDKKKHTHTQHITTPTTESKTPPIRVKLAGIELCDAYSSTAKRPRLFPLAIIQRSHGRSNLIRLFTFRGSKYASHSEAVQRV